MATVKFTDKGVASIKPPESGRLELWDALVPGFGIRVTAAGGRSWVFRYRLRGQEQKGCLTLGRFPALGLADARARAREAAAEVACGVDPAGPASPDRFRHPLTFSSLADRFIEEYAKPRKRTWAEDAARLRNRLVPAWGDRPADSITHGDIAALIASIVNEGHAIAANRSRSLISKLFRWAVSATDAEGRRLLTRNPAADMAPPAHENERDRVLSADELAKIWHAAGGLSRDWGRFVRMLILTGQRRDEVAGMRREEIQDASWGSYRGIIWTIPPERSKNGTASLVPLVGMAYEIVAGDNPGFVFPARRNENAHISGYSKAKTSLDKLSGVSNWRFHDLRRTFATRLAEQGCDPHIIEACLNHVSGQISGVARIYNRHKYLIEKRTTLEGWNQQLIEQGLGLDAR